MEYNTLPLQHGTNNVNSTRRQFVAVAALGLTGFSGCLTSSSTETIEELQLQLINQTATPLTVHFVLESENGLGQWHEFDIGADSRRVVGFEPGFEQDSAEYHAVVGERRVSGTIFPQEEGMGTCYELMFRIDENEIAVPQMTDPCADD